MKVLLVDDDATLADVTTFALRRAGFFVFTAYDGQQAMQLWEDEQPQLVILDIQLPDKDGLTLCREIRAMSDVPIILLTVHSSDEDIVYGLEIGADDYITKPFSPKQLIARTQAVLRRSMAFSKQNPLVTDELVLNPSQQTVHTTHGSLRLTRLEFRLLQYLVINRGQVVRTDAILSHVWGYANGDDRALLKQLVYRLRQKIEALHDISSCIETVPGLGYTLTSKHLSEAAVSSS